MKDLKYQIKGRQLEKLTEKFVGPYQVKGIVLTNAIELDLPSIIKIYPVVNMSQTSFGHISINSLTIIMVLMATESPQRDLLINASHISRQSVLVKILSRSTGNYHVTVY